MTDAEWLRIFELRLDSLAYTLEKTSSVISAWGSKDAGDLMQRQAADTRALLAEFHDRRRTTGRGASEQQP